MPFTPAAQAALLKWVNTRSPEHPAESIDDLADGVTFSHILHSLDPSYDTSELDMNLGTSTWLTQKRNLQSVYKGLFKYIRREAPDCVPLAQVADFRAIAENPDVAGLSQLIAVFLATAVMNTDQHIRSKAIESLQTDLAPVEQIEIRGILEQKQQEISELTTAASLEESRDSGLEAEEERSKIASELDKKIHDLELAQKRYVDLDSRHRYLQGSHDEIKAKLESVETELEELHKITGTNESQRVQSLQTKLDEQSTLIATQEDELKTYETTQKQMELELERLKSSQIEGQEFKDKYDELNHQYQDLVRKANAADRYKQKLATQRNLEQEIATLQFELEAKQDLDDQLKRAIFEKQKLEATQSEILSAMSNNEQSLAEERDQKERLKALVDELRAEYAKLLHQNNVNEKYIEEMKDSMGVHGFPAAASTPDAEQTTFNLEEELQQQNTDPTVALNLQISRLQSENSMLRAGMSVGTQMEDLRGEFEEVKVERDIAKKQYEMFFEKFGVAQEQIDALIANATGEGSKAFQNLRERAGRTTSELDREKAKNSELEEQVKDKDRELLSVKTDLDAVAKESLEALEALKSSDQLISASLRSELENLRKLYRALQIENDMHKSQLLEALIAKEKIAKERDGADAVVVAPEGVDRTVLENALKGARSKLEKLRDRTKDQLTQLEKADQERYELQKRLKALESGSALAAQKAASDEIIQNLKRENAMIATAWYDLTSRLQSNHVVLQRKDQPKSWIGKQRQMMNATPRR